MDVALANGSISAVDVMATKKAGLQKPKLDLICLDYKSTPYKLQLETFFHKHMISYNKIGEL